MKYPLDYWRGTTSSQDWGQLTQASRLLDRFMEDFGLSPTKKGSTPWAFSPPCEVTEEKSQFLFKFDLPGLTRDQVKIELHENQLTVTGERKEEKKEDNKRYHVSETSYGSFMRTFTLPSNIDAEKVEAKFDNGVLTVAVSKAEPSRTRQVTIK